MDWETSNSVGDRLLVPSYSKMRSLSTSTPVISVHGGGKLTRSHSVSVCSSNDSGLGDSMVHVPGADSFNTPDFVLNISSCSNFSSTSQTSTVCPTPKVSLFDTTLCKRRQLEFSVSPVLKQKNVASRSVDLDFSFVSEVDQDDTISDESAKYLSRLNLDSGIECPASADYLPHIPRLTLDVDIDSLVQHLPSSTCNRDTNFYSNIDIKRINSVERKLPPEFKRFLQQFLPEERDRLIGAKMGIDHVDILEELQVRGMARVLSSILRYLDTTDLNSVYAVSGSWQTILENDRDAQKRRKEYLKKKRKPEFCGYGKENMRKKSPSPPSRNVVGSGPLQSLGNLQPPNPAVEITPERHLTRLDLFVEASKQLKSDERLQKCPRCCKPARVLPVQERGICLQSNCAFDYCINCYNKFHRSQPCVPVSLKRAKTDTVGHKKSKKNLKRL